jgi:GGDEF domain-containing protein
VAPQVAVALENAQRYQRTTELCAKDELTGLANRRAFFEALEAEDQRARRSRLGSTRRADVVARCGGEEFVVLPESLKAAGAQHPIPGREQQPGGRLTVTCGVAAYPGDAADRALYRGKQQGGNRVVVAPEGE